MSEKMKSFDITVYDVIVTWNNLLEPRKYETKEKDKDGNPVVQENYNLTFIIDKDNEQFNQELLPNYLKLFKDAGFAQSDSTIIRPIKDGDKEFKVLEEKVELGQISEEDLKKNEYMKGKYIVRCKSKQKPAAFLNVKDKEGNWVAIDDSKHLYPGMQGHVYISLSPWEMEVENQGKKGKARGVSSKIVYFMKTKDHPRMEIGNSIPKKSVEDAFGDVKPVKQNQETASNDSENSEDFSAAEGLI